MNRAGSLLFSAQRASQGGEKKEIAVLRRRDAAGFEYERIGKLLWRQFENDWYFVRLQPVTCSWQPDTRIAGVDLREAKRLTDTHYGIGDHPK